MRGSGTIARSPRTAPSALVRGALPFALLVPLAAVPARAEIIRTATSVIFSGSISNSGGPVSVRATLWTDPSLPGTLSLLLQNTSTAATIAPAGLLTSFYFGVYGGTTSGTAPTLSYLTGTGQVYQPVRNGGDIPGVYVPPVTAGGDGTFTAYASGLSNLMALKKGDDTWQFKSGLSLVASAPPLNFGIGTVGNANLAPNGFNGDIVGGNDFGIYVGDASTQSLQGVGLVVSGSALFRFGGFIAPTWTIANIPSHAVFGLGSGPDLIISVPEPGTVALAAIGVTAALGLRRRTRRCRSRARRDCRRDRVAESASRNPCGVVLLRLGVALSLASATPHRERLGVPGVPEGFPEARGRRPERAISVDELLGSRLFPRPGAA